MSDKNERPGAYPQPTETDNQLKNQDEYSTLQPNNLQDVQDVSAPAPKEGEAPSTENKSIEGS
jgi:hypothetical protein